MRDYINLDNLDNCILIEGMSVRIYDDYRPAKVVVSYENFYQFIWRKNNPNGLPQMGIVHMGSMTRKHVRGTQVWVESSQLLMVLK